MRWILAFHIIGVICWFAGLFYLPRLFVYHAETKDSISNERFKLMERRLYWGIMTPAAIATLFSGIWLLHYNFNYYLHAAWMITKLFLVLLLLIYHGLCGFYLRQFKLNRNKHSSLFYRFFNEIPTLLLIGIVLLIFIQPSLALLRAQL